MIISQFGHETCLSKGLIDIINRVNINGDWDVKSLPEAGQKEINFKAKVPGCVIEGLINENIIDRDVFWRDNAKAVKDYEKYNWLYSKHFELKDVTSGASITFERLDTYCDIFLNGKHLAKCENGFISHTFSVDGFLKNGTNLIEIYFYSPVNKVLGMQKLPGAFTTERLHTRRMQCTYGWDWVARFVTCGIGGDVYLTFNDGKDISVESAYVYTKNIDEDSAGVGADVFLNDCKNGEILDFVIFAPDGKVAAKRVRYCAENHVRLSFDVPNALLWYPNGYGEQPLYEFAITSDKTQKELYRLKFGIRSVKILEIPDEPESDNYKKCLLLKKTDFSAEYDKNTEFSGFILKINGIKIMCKGADWVPCQPFTMPGNAEKITEVLELAASAGVNMLRVWGGGQFESDHFYSECSRLGITVTQDFFMACGRYPEDNAEFLSQLRKEAEHAVKKLRNHTCLVWWSGDNENAVNGCDTDEDYPGRSSAFKAIAPVLYKEDPYRDFLPSSPYGGKNYASNTVGTTHNSQYLGYFFDHISSENDLSDYKDYFKKYNARFIAEEPTIGAVSSISLKKMMSDEDIYSSDDEMWKYHMQTNPGLKKHLFDYLCDFSRKILGGFSDSADRLFKLKYAQYEWIRITLERARREKWFCSGIVYWMLNDCWPASAGWALIDYYCLPKASYYAFKRAAKQLILSIDREEGKYSFHVSNDGLKPRDITLVMKEISGEGMIISDKQIAAKSVKPNNSEVIFSLNDGELQGNTALLAGELCENGRMIDRAFYMDGALKLYPCQEAVSYEMVDDSNIKVTAGSYVHALEIEGAAVFDDNYFSLLPGETKTVSCIKKHSDFTLPLSVKAYTVKK